MLSAFAAAVVVADLIATVVAIVVNLPSQFGIVGTDASTEALTSGTAISAPLIPVVSLLVVVALEGRHDRWPWLGIAAGCVSRSASPSAGYGELTGEPTENTPGDPRRRRDRLPVIALALAVLLGRRSSTPGRQQRTWNAGPSSSSNAGAAGSADMHPHPHDIRARLPRWDRPTVRPG